MSVLVGDCVELMRDLEPASVDAVVCDPPYGLEFMGKEWDRLGRNSPPSFEHSMQDDFKGFKPLPRPGGLTLEGMHASQRWHHTWATEALCVLRPGGHLLAFGGTRTYHRLVCAIEDAGFEIRDTIAWMYGSGFPKSRNIGGGWGTALKPAHEPIVVARKPLAGTVAGNVLEHGTGALNVDGCRVEADYENEPGRGPGWLGSGRQETPDGTWQGPGVKQDGSTVADRVSPLGRWPTNVVLDEAAAATLDEQTGELQKNAPALYINESADNHVFGDGMGKRRAGDVRPGFSDSGGASRFFYTTNQEAEYAEDGLHNLDCDLDESCDCHPRLPSGRRGDLEGKGERGEAVSDLRKADEETRFFYVPKASRAERNAGLEGFEERTEGMAVEGFRDGSLHAVNVTRKDQGPSERKPIRNHHPTVKPIALMRWLVRLVTPPGGLILDPFTGSGTTGIAAGLEGFDFLGMEQDEGYAKIAEARIAWWAEHGADALRIVAERERAEAERAEVLAAGQLELL